MEKYKILLEYDDMIQQWKAILLLKNGLWDKYKMVRHRACNGEVVAGRWAVELNAKIKHIK